jgi:hypothetical protein
MFRREHDPSGKFVLNSPPGDRDSPRDQSVASPNSRTVNSRRRQSKAKSRGGGFELDQSVKTVGASVAHPKVPDFIAAAAG